MRVYAEPMDVTSAFATYLKELMRRRGLRPTQVATLAGVTKPSVQGWLKGTQPRPEALERLADSLPGEDYWEMMQAAGYRTPNTGVIDGVPVAIADEFARWLYRLDEAQREVDEASRKLAEVREQGQHFGHRLSGGAAAK